MNLQEAQRFFRIGVDWWGRGGKPESIEEAQRRANICLQCPNNVQGFPIKESLVGAVRNALALKNRCKLKVENEEKLHVCSVCGCVLKLLVFTPPAVIIKDSETNQELQYPDFCWKKKIIDSSK